MAHQSLVSSLNIPSTILETEFPPATAETKGAQTFARKLFGKQSQSIHKPDRSRAGSFATFDTNTADPTLLSLYALIGENPVRLRCGKNIILAQSGFRAGQMTVTATSDGLRPPSVVVKTTPVGPDVDMPKDLPIHPRLTRSPGRPA